MQYLLVINGQALRIGTKEQMLDFIGTYLPHDTDARIMPMQEVKRTIPYWYYSDSEKYGSSLYIFPDNAKLYAEGKPVIELPVHQPQGILL